MKTKILSILLIAMITITNCKKEKDDKTGQLGLLFLLTNSSTAATQTSDVSTPVGQSTSVSSAISGISSSVTTTSNTSSFTMKDKNAMEREEMFAINSVLRYGKDSQKAKDAVVNMLKKKVEFAKSQAAKANAEKRLTAWSSSTTDSDGFTSYTFSGTVKGASYSRGETDVTAFTSGSTSCKVTGYTTVGKVDQGTAAFTNGSYKTKFSGTSTGTTGLTSQTKTSADVTFTNFGTLYTDIYKAIALLKKYSGTSLFTSTKPECSVYQAYYADFDATYNQATIAGTLSYTTDSNSLIKYSSSTSYSITGTFTSTSNSTAGLTITQGGKTASNVTLKDLKFTGLSDYSSASGTLSGKYTITITGTVSGSAINETLAVIF